MKAALTGTRSAGFRKWFEGKVKGDEDGTESLKKLIRAMDLGRKIKQGSVLEFYVSPRGGELVTLLDGRVLSIVDDGGKLGKAVLTTYLGRDSVFAKYKNTSFAFLS